LGVVDLAWSPDGTQIAIARSLFAAADQGDITANNGIYLVNVDGPDREPQPFVLMPQVNSTYASLTDMLSLAYTAFYGIDWVRWSPDGGTPAFQPAPFPAPASLNELAVPLFVANVDTGRLLGYDLMPRVEALLDWFPDASSFAYTIDTYLTQNAVGLTNEPGARASEGKQRPLDGCPAGYKSAAICTVSGGHDAWPEVSPDGSRIVFQGSERPGRLSPPAGVDKVEGPREGIWTVNADGTEPRQLTADPASLDYYPQWSAKGDTIMFARTDGRSLSEMSETEEAPRAELWLMRADGSDARMLVSDLSRVGGFPLLRWDSVIAWYRAPVR
jgi:Tol biopolymer transport system component